MDYDPNQMSRRRADYEIEQLRTLVDMIQKELATKASKEDIASLRSRVDEKAEDLRDAINARVTIERYRLVEGAVLGSVAAACMALFAWIWKQIQMLGGGP